MMKMLIFRGELDGPKQRGSYVFFALEPNTQYQVRNMMMLVMMMMMRRMNMMMIAMMTMVVMILPKGASSSSK